MQEYDGSLSFGMDAWTSPNHKVYMAVTVHFEHNGQPISLLLDIVEVPHSHMEVNLAKAIADVLYDFEIDDKVRMINKDDNNVDSPRNPDPQYYL